ncbi:FHA domain-containing protein [Pelagicoccus sp. NFK12]|uniref:FHA domain-containing protein n=1 Tax=Pelagicoccus enzymogenes TaxID=2773457 RepID=A0A927IJJ2_9BACT|nr:FHA domain-containing protein [Pelagicoccus enzymogenes]MBD5782386.1 FHA domain-containing protein [Pelagicoccus enzymogenes]
MNSTEPSFKKDATIRITRSDAMSPEVDTFINRQKSLKGESGIKKGKRAWFYQNWFVYMVVGTLAAAAAWLLIDPVYSDYIYIQGEIEEVNFTDRNSPEISWGGEESVNITFANNGWIRIRGEQIWLWHKLEGVGSSTAEIPLSELVPGREIGVHLEYYANYEKQLPIAMYVDLSPPALDAESASMDIAELSIRNETVGSLIFAIVGGLVGLAIGAADGILCRLPRRALLAGGIGLVAGFIGGFLSSIIANIAYDPITSLAMSNTADTGTGLSTVGFVIQMAGRAFSWALAGMAMGLGQGLALRSSRLVLYGLLGGILGGLLGGLLFDPVDLILLSSENETARISRLVSFCLVGASIGAMIGIVELLARDSWLRMQKGPLAGKEFIMFKDIMKIGSSPSSDIYLFNDETVAPHHATIRAVGEYSEIESQSSSKSVKVNNRTIQRSRLRQGDSIEIGNTVFVFESKQ